jgi:hypothetical protein
MNTAKDALRNGRGWRRQRNYLGSLLAVLIAAATPKDAAPGPTPDGFHDFLVALRQEVIAFEKPVAYVHGDSHYFRVDKPFLDAQGRRLENFTRVETFGDNTFKNDPASDNNNVPWLKVFVDATSREVSAIRLTECSPDGPMARSEPCRFLLRRMRAPDG